MPIQRPVLLPWAARRQSTASVVPWIGAPLHLLAKYQPCGLCIRIENEGGEAWKFGEGSGAAGLGDRRRQQQSFKHVLNTAKHVGWDSELTPRFLLRSVFSTSLAYTTDVVLSRLSFSARVFSFTPLHAPVSSLSLFPVFSGAVCSSFFFFPVKPGSLSLSRSWKWKPFVKLILPPDPHILWADVGGTNSAGTDQGGDHFWMQSAKKTVQQGADWVGTSRWPILALGFYFGFFVGYFLRRENIPECTRGTFRCGWAPLLLVHQKGIQSIQPLRRLHYPKRSACVSFPGGNNAMAAISAPFYLLFI